MNCFPECTSLTAIQHNLIHSWLHWRNTCNKKQESRQKMVMSSNIIVHSVLHLFWTSHLKFSYSLQQLLPLTIHSYQKMKIRNRSLIHFSANTELMYTVCFLIFILLSYEFQEIEPPRETIPNRHRNLLIVKCITWTVNKVFLLMFTTALLTSLYPSLSTMHTSPKHFCACTFQHDHHFLKMLISS